MKRYHIIVIGGSSTARYTIEATTFELTRRVYDFYVNDPKTNRNETVATFPLERTIIEKIEKIDESG